ncbi:MAG: HAMP domain-containing histidine kinase [Deltaproteobacteria bacterium]|nr:HAMP domain-containing histidine kinase [Deltaproteobacteria bacterium]MBI3294469.1 HAMP domain-containing histidine kinase [Deltaproteobacteria bacterium]
MNRPLSLASLFLPSIRLRISFLILVVVATALIGTSFVCYKIFSRTHQSDFDAFLYNLAIDASLPLHIESLKKGSALAESDYLPRKHRLFAVEKTYARIIDEDGSLIAHSNGLNPDVIFPSSAAERALALEKGASYQTVRRFPPENTPYRLLTYRLSRTPRPYYLQMAAPLTLIEEEKRDFLVLLFILIPVSLLVSGGLGYWATHRALRPVSNMIAKTQGIEVSNLKTRIEVEESDAEIRDLGKTLNQLLDQVENALTAQERFIADASHQLKTPLAIIRGQLELLQARQDHPTDVKDALQDTSQEVSQLIGLVQNLLMLARVDAGLGMIDFHKLRLDELLSEASGRLKFVARRKGVRISTDLKPFTHQALDAIDFEYRGDPDLIRCLLENLMENAIKYSPDNGAVTVRLIESRDDYRIEVSDSGKGMTETEVSNIFGRFWRDPKKSTTVPGFGLGLAIVKKIAEVHSGSLFVESRLGIGSTFQVTLRKTATAKDFV